ncbi:MAG: hypothetical protein ABIY56_11085 [Dokdonella sp.]
MNVGTPELLLALRAPTSTWLATLLCALDEAMRDEHFSASQRALLQSVLSAGQVPSAVVKAADQRMQQFEETVQADTSATLEEILAQLDEATEEPTEVATSRPHLTLCVNAA